MARTSTAPSTVAQEALAYCTSCKMDLAHTVVAMKGDRIAKVECKTCKKIHVYKAPKGITEPTAAKPKKERAKKGAAAAASSIEAEWEKLMTAHKDAPFKSYTTKGQFALGDKIKHPSFGDGIVGRLIFPNKVEVIFQTNVRVLISGGAAR